MRFPVRDRLVRAYLRFEELEDRTTPTAALPSITAIAPLDCVNVVMATAGESTAAEAELGAAPFAANVEYLGFSIYRVALTAGTTAASADAYYSTQPHVVSASPDASVHVQSVPNDPSISSLWALKQISAPAAWKTTTGSSNIVVAEIDSGIDYTHPDLAANIWTNPGEVAGNGRDDDHNGFVDDIHGWDFANNDNNPMDDNGHGTHVAGIIGAVGNNGIGVVGVDWSVKVMPLKFLDASGNGVTSNAIKAMNYAVMMGAKVINLSWGGGPPDPALSAAIASARSAGDIVVIAAGNDGANIDVNKEFPASYSTSYNNVVTVAATDSQDNLALFSNYGPKSVTLAAPGVNILSTTPNDTYSTMSGTSMATPHVTGAIALLWSAHPSWNYLQVINKLKSSVDPVPGLVGKVQTGGRLDVGAMLAGTTATLAASTPGPVVLSSSFSGTASTNLKRVRFTFDRPVNPATFTAADIDSFTGPKGPIHTNYVITPVAGSRNKQFDVWFGLQTAPGLYSMTIGPNIQDALGHSMNQDGDGIAGESLQDRYLATGLLVLPLIRSYAAAGLPQPITDFHTTASSITISDAIQISDLSVGVSIQHTQDSDLFIRLRSPTGQYVVLFAKRGGSGDNLTDTVFDDQAGLAIGSTGAKPPFTGSFRPEQPLSTLNGMSALGTWTLEVYDGALHDTGALLAWSLTISGTLGISSPQPTTAGFAAELPVSTMAAAGSATLPVILTANASLPRAESIPPHRSTRSGIGTDILE